MRRRKVITNQSKLTLMVCGQPATIKSNEVMVQIVDQNHPYDCNDPRCVVAMNPNASGEEHQRCIDTFVERIKRRLFNMP